MSIHKDHNGVEVLEVIALHEYNILTEDGVVGTVCFQNGPAAENGVNGATNEALLAILIHRTKGLNKLYPCRENSIAITKMQEALMWLEERTSDRVERGVEGKNKE